MNTLLAFLVALAVFVVGCSNPSSSLSPQSSKPEVHWFRNEQGFITSGVKPNVPVLWSSQDGKEGGVRFDSPKEVEDPLEDASEFVEAFRDAITQADAAAQRCAGQLGCIHAYWEKKKEVLRNKYKIDWKSPADLNPSTSYD